MSLWKLIQHSFILSFFLIHLVYFAEGSDKAQTSRGLHTVVFVGGHPTVTRKDATGPVPVVLNMKLFDGDMLNVPAFSVVKILCAGNDITQVTNQVGPFQCSAAAPVILDRGIAIQPPRGGGPVGCPAIIAPRHTKILSLRPALRWASVPGEANYTVGIRTSEGDVLWTVNAGTATTIEFPQNKPPLEAGTTYKLVISTRTSSSDDEKVPNLGFTTATAEEANRIGVDADKIRALEISEAQKALLLARLYSSYGFRAEAIEKIEAQPFMVGDCYAPLLLGDLYLSIGLGKESEENYSKALQLAQTSGAEEGEAEAHAGLGKVYGLLGEVDQAKAHLTAARMLYEKQGNLAQAKQVSDLLDTVSDVNNKE